MRAEIFIDLAHITIGAAEPQGGEQWHAAECHLCFNCEGSCPEDVIHFEFFPRRSDVAVGTDLSKRDRSLITVAVLTALYRTDELRGHMRRALENGVTKEEIGGLVTHIAFYAGWPTAVNAGRVALEVFDED